MKFDGKALKLSYKLSCFCLDFNFSSIFKNKSELHEFMRNRLNMSINFDDALVNAKLNGSEVSTLA